MEQSIGLEMREEDVIKINCVGNWDHFNGKVFCTYFLLPQFPDMYGIWNTRYVRSTYKVPTRYTVLVEGECI